MRKLSITLSIASIASCFCLQQENYCQIHGLPTLGSVCPASQKCACWQDTAYEEHVGRYRRSWLAAFVEGREMREVIARTECDQCRLTREARRRVLDPEKPVPAEIATQTFADAPAIYSFNVPRYFTTQLRARRFAASGGLPVTWVYAKDVPLHRDDLELSADALNHKMMAWLKRHDQDTSHLASVLPLVVGRPICVPDRTTAPDPTESHACVIPCWQVFRERPKAGQTRGGPDRSISLPARGLAVWGL